MKTTTTFDLFNPAPAWVPVVEKGAENEPLKQISGLTYLEDFISKEEELTLVDTINVQQWLGDLKRRVQHYGWKYDYRARSLNRDMYLGALPAWAFLLAQRLVKLGLMEEVPDQVIINEYKPGQGIANHVDCEPCFGDTIISLSLSTPCAMQFIHLRSKEKIEKILHPRSVVCIKGPARYEWSHGIAARLADDINGIRTNRSLRISMTFRKVIV
ncbi:alpha-ketoglutarate-dependent dioxygenase AlkB [Pedobacter agri]|uniref:alpha-ketoglutarate-dependent dioxygenase AlkB n=1 Tax=Pedobacter agri TaxID=454586 RepID=UPI00277F298C|nr:alpha-ketoglutarate-dependent dioxygenase AlkB [Pedobacter agri]MDQ1140117.1 alkylated DNA repair dioxygenase AlkB [Pedobacter agri]